MTSTPTREALERLRENLQPVTNGFGEVIGYVEIAASDLSLALGLLDRQREALEKVERWFGEFPETGETWNDGSPMSYAACFGSHGERDFMREIARQALSDLAPDSRE